ncbi:MAG: aldose 1-epimerase family protein [Lachnospiraceae bacterium]|nr:aldose 1-epimerase family protein [Ruminococcus sp.]MCM1274581.1 aldose 1-epimerase family protein [Lachnospiraceae bacterium]
MDIQLKNDGCTARLISKGAELKSLTVGRRELMWRADPAFWGKTSPLLFPMIGTLRNGKTLINGREYGITKHGFARDLELSVESVNGTSVTFSLEQSDYTLKMYPFDFRFTVTYTLKSDGIAVTYRVKNNSPEPMPFCIGAHPAFACGGEFTDYRLEFAKPETAAVPNYNLETGLHEENNRRPLLNGETTLTLKHELFYGDVCYFDKVVSRSVMLLDKENKGVCVDFPDFTSLGVWQAKDAPFLCIEPWCGSADFDDATGVFAEKRGAVTLNSGGERAFTYSISAVG